MKFISTWIFCFLYLIGYSQKLCGELRNFVIDGQEIVFYAFAYIEPLYSRQLRITPIFEIRYVVDSGRNLNDAITNHLAVEFEQYLRGTRPNGVYTKNGYAWQWQNRGVVRCPNLEFVQAARAEMVREYLEKNKYDDIREDFQQKGWFYRPQTKLHLQEFQNIVYRKKELIYPDKPFQDSINYHHYNNYPYYGHFSPYNLKPKSNPTISVEEISEEDSKKFKPKKTTDKTEDDNIKRRQVIEELDFRFEYPMNQYYKGKTKVLITPLN